MNQNQPMKVLTLKEFALEKKFTQIVPKLRKNVNNYPFVTFITKDNKGENIYLSKSLAESTKIVELDKSWFSQVSVGYTKNAKGEERVKLISNSERVSIEDIL